MNDFFIISSNEAFAYAKQVNNSLCISSSLTPSRIFIIFIKSMSPVVPFLIIDCRCVGKMQTNRSYFNIFIRAVSARPISSFRNGGAHDSKTPKGSLEAVSFQPEKLSSLSRNSMKSRLGLRGSL